MFLKSSDGVIAQLECPLFNAGKPAFKAREVKRILLATDQARERLSQSIRSGDWLPVRHRYPRGDTRRANVVFPVRVFLKLLASTVDWTIPTGITLALASSPDNASSVSGCTLRRHLSAIGTGCANERSSGSEEGVVSNHDPYSDRHLELLCRSKGECPDTIFTRWTTSKC